MLLMRLVRLIAIPMNMFFSGRRTARVILVANSRTREALPYRSPRCVIELKPNAVDTGFWQRPSRHEDNDPIRFAFLGELVHFKAVDILLRAFRRVVDRIPAELEIIGEGPERKSLERLTRRLGLAERVDFCGRLDGQELADRLGQASVFTFPSLREAGGAVVLEAMSLGLPVIAADWGGPAEFLGPDEGILVPPDSPASFEAGFAAAMLRLAADKELRERLGRAARAKVVAEYTWDDRVQRLLEIYRSVGDRIPFDPGKAAAPGALDQ